jgi:hypothetical protein
VISIAPLPRKIGPFTVGNTLCKVEYQEVISGSVVM